MKFTTQLNLLRWSPLVKTVFFLSAIAFLLVSCRTAEERSNPYVVNTAHLDSLYGEMNVAGEEVGFVHIYAEYPDYHMVGDEDEGFACVDDAARAAIFYARQYTISANPEHLRKAEMLLKFLLVMQAPNGYYYNFIWPDGRIHTDGVTTVAEPNWWSWRVLWAFSEASILLEPDSTPLLSRIRAQRNTLVNNILHEPSFQSDQMDTIEGLMIPTWLPGNSGADQAALILIGLAEMLEQKEYADVVSGDTLVSLIRHLADGIGMMQIHARDSIQDGAFLSWANLWHAYGNSQAYALLKVSQVLEEPGYAEMALYEIDHFYPAVIHAGGFDFFWVQKKDSTISRRQTQVFSQIAYGRRPMIFAAIAAYEITGDEKYLVLAGDLGKWFAGENKAGIVMYDPVTGRGYDGIISDTEINKNAGAESTIESLLAVQALGKYGE